MASDSFSARTRLAADLVARARRGVVRRLHQSGLCRWRYSGAPIEQLVLVPPDLRTADPSFASEIYHGHFGLAGAVGRTGTRSPFLIFPPTPDWAVELHGFGWMRHLRAAGDKISHEHARVLVRDWIDIYGAIGGLAWRPDVVARRVISWLCHLPIILEGAGQETYDEVMESLSRQVRYLCASLADMGPGAARLRALIALLLTRLCTDEQSLDAGALTRAFAHEAGAQILSDGGHVSRNPAVLIELLLDLLPLRQCFIVRDQPPPEALVQVIERMMPMLRFFRLGDGALARFNGAGPTAIDEVVNVLAHDDTKGAPLTHAAPSGYCRLVQGKTVLIADVGPPPPLAHSRRAHAGCLSFELSSGAHPVIVNCGALNHIKKEWRLVVRTTAAHSTLSLANASSSRFVAFPWLGEAAADARLTGPGRVSARTRAKDGVLDLEAAHDGYARRFGLIHTRSLRLMNGGARLEGADLLTPVPARREAGGAAGEVGYALRFHLHPSIRAELASDGQSALLVLPNREGWRLATRTGKLSVEESVYLATMSGRNRTQQVVLTGACDPAAGAKLMWRLEQGARAKARARTGGAAEPKPEAARELPLEENR